MEIIRTGLRNHVDDAGSRAPKFGGCAGGHDLKLFDCIQRNVDRGPLSAELLAKESIVVIAAIHAHIVKNATLAGEIDFITVRTLYDADAGRQREQVFEFSTENRSVI